MSEKRYSGTGLLLLIGVGAVVMFALLMYHLFESDKTLPENIKILNELHTARTKACDRSINIEGCEAAQKALKDYLREIRKKAPEGNH